MATTASGNSRSRKALHVILWIIVGLLALAVVVRLVLDPIVSHEVRKKLDALDGYVSDFQRIHVTVLAPSFEIWRFKLAEAHPSEEGDRKALDKDPLVFVEHARLSTDWRSLLRGRIEGRLRLESPKIVVVQSEKKKPSKTPAPPDLSRQLRKALPLRVERIEVVGGEVLFRMLQSSNDESPAELWLHRIEAAVENIGTRRNLLHGRAATVTLHAVVGRSGDLTAFLSADPLSSPLNFAGDVALRDLRAEELYDFIAPKTGMQTAGTIDLFVSFESHQGAIRGGVKPVLKNIDVHAVGESVWDRLKAWLADKSVDIASDRVPGRRAIATTIPIKGKLTSPDVQIWPAVLGVVRNAFVEGLESGFANVPPINAEGSESAWKQTKDALKKDHGPPRAQPAKSK